MEREDRRSRAVHTNITCRYDWWDTYSCWNKRRMRITVSMTLPHRPDWLTDRLGQLRLYSRLSWVPANTGCSWTCHNLDLLHTIYMTGRTGEFQQVHKVFTLFDACCYWQIYRIIVRCHYKLVEHNWMRDVKSIRMRYRWTGISDDGTRIYLKVG